LSRRPKTKSERRRINRMKFVVTVDRDEDGVFVAQCPAIPGCVSQGRTEGEALKNIEDAIRECLEVRAEKGMPLTVAVHQVDVSV
jgi:predicted RNase H-like HicB family nuclease